MSTSVIHKYPLIEGGELMPVLPVEAVILYVGEQYGSLYMWVKVPTAVTKTLVRLISVIGTGHSFRDDGTAKYIGTVQMSNGLVWHVFESSKF